MPCKLVMVPVAIVDEVRVSNIGNKNNGVFSRIFCLFWILPWGKVGN